jgi:hypothetical protein
MIAAWWAVTKIKLLAWWGFIAAIGAALLGLWLWGRKSGASAQADKDKAAQADDAVRAAAAAQDVQQAAASAVAAVREQAAKQPPPDVVKRDDFNNTGFSP